MPSKIILPPLHIKLGLLKNFAKALHKKGRGFKLLQELFSKLSERKLKEDIVVGPEIRKFLKDQTNDANITNLKLAAWTYFGDIVHGFCVIKKTMDMILY